MDEIIFRGFVGEIILQSDIHAANLEVQNSRKRVSKSDRERFYLIALQCYNRMHAMRKNIPESLLSRYDEVLQRLNSSYNETLKILGF